MRCPTASSVIACSILLGAITSGATACPICDPETGDEVRAGIIGDDTMRSVLAVALPFATFASVAALLHFGVPGRGRKE